MVLPGDLVAGRQTVRTLESREGQNEGGKTGTTIVPEIPPGRHTETIPRGRNFH